MDLSAHFTDKETRVLGGEVTFLRSHTGATLLVLVEVGRLGAEAQEVLGAVSVTSRSPPAWPPASVFGAHSGEVQHECPLPVTLYP